MSTSKSRNEQRRADDFEAFVQRFLKALGYILIEKHPKIGTKRADLLVTRGERPCPKTESCPGIQDPAQKSGIADFNISNPFSRQKGGNELSALRTALSKHPATNLGWACS